MEEPPSGTSLPAADESDGAAVARPRRGPGTTAATAAAAASASDAAGRRRSLADFTELRRRDAAQFRGLVIPSLDRRDRGGAKPVDLPTIGVARPPPQSRLPPTSSAQQRRGSTTGYQSVWTGLPFGTSASRSSAPDPAQRRSGDDGRPLVGARRSSDASFSSSSRLSQPVELSADRDDADVGADKRDFSRREDDGCERKSTFPAATAVDRVGASASLSSNISPPRRPGGRPAADAEGTDSDGSFLLSSPSSASERSTGAESPTMNRLTTGERHEERSPGDDVVAAQSGCCSCLSDEVDAEDCARPMFDRSVVSPIEALQSLTAVDSSCVGFPTSGGEMAPGSGRGEVSSDTGDAADVERRDCALSRPNAAFNRDSAESVSSPRDTAAALKEVVIDKGSLGLGFCITGGRAGTTGDDPVVVKRVFGGSC